ncbi:MAG: hypothetical protein ACREPQ_14590 [Rhodanobacter sp.]
MSDYLKAFWNGCIQGAKETPRGFFAPLVALFRWLDRATDEALAENQSSESRLAGHH